MQKHNTNQVFARAEVDIPEETINEVVAQLKFATVLDVGYSEEKPHPKETK